MTAKRGFMAALLSNIKAWFVARFQLVEGWRVVLKRSWTQRLLLLSSVLSALEFALPYLDWLMPRGVFAALAFATTLAAGYARLVVQKRMREEVRRG